MKIRIKGNSLRYRLTRPEVETFALKGVVEEKINFGVAELNYALRINKDSVLSATFEDNRITAWVPESMARSWAKSQQVGFENVMALQGSGEKLFILIEKDFTCLDQVDEDQRDNYPNPLLKNRL